MKLAACETKALALERGLDVYQPASVRTGEALELMRSLAPDRLCVVAYGKILPDELLAVPRYGAINVHGSLLPRYRGAAPIQWSVLNGDEYAGVTTMYLAHDMDAGDVIFREATKVGEYETAGELFDRLAIMGAKLLVRTLARHRGRHGPARAAGRGRGHLCRPARQEHLPHRLGAHAARDNKAYLRPQPLARRHDGARRRDDEGLRGRIHR